jgi:hypothetical protein
MNAGQRLATNEQGSSQVLEVVVNGRWMNAALISNFVDTPIQSPMCTRPQDVHDPISGHVII